MYVCIPAMSTTRPLYLCSATRDLILEKLNTGVKSRCGADSTAAVEADCALTPVSSFMYLQGRCTPYGARDPC
jgi:hypothetical protein